MDEHERVTVRIQPQVSRIRKTPGLIPLPEQADAKDYLLGPENHPWEQSMTFADIPSGAAVFIDANSIIYHFISEPTYGAASTKLLERLELTKSRGGLRRTFSRKRHTG